MVTGGFRRSWILLVGTPPFYLRERLTRVCGYSQRWLVADSEAGGKRGPALGEKPRPGAKDYGDLSSTFRTQAGDKRCFSGRARSRSTPRCVSSQRRLAALAFYSHIFCSGTWK